MRSRRSRRNRSGAPKPAGERPAPAPARPAAQGSPSPDGGGRRRNRRRRSGRGRGESNAPLTLDQVRVRFEKQLRDYPPAFEKTEDFLALCRTLEEAVEKGEVEGPSAEEFFYYTASSIETLAEEEIDQVFNAKYRASLAEIRKEEGLEENQFWKPGDPAVPERYQDLLSEFRAEKREILASAFEEHEDPETATLVREDFEEYTRRKLAGRALFRRRDPLDPLVQRIIASGNGEAVPDVEEEAAEAAEGRPPEASTENPTD